MASYSNQIMDESEDLFDADIPMIQDPMVLGSDKCEMTAAAALTSLVRSPPMSGQEDNDDHEYDDDVDEDDIDEKNFTIPQRFTKSGRKRAVSFVLKLMKVLSNKKYENVIKWMPSGKSFSIVDPKAFTAEVLPEHFKSAKYSSFTRKLHRWGFVRHYRGEEAGAFFHKSFQRDRLDLVEKMSCQKMDPIKPSQNPTPTPPPTMAPVPRKAELTPNQMSAFTPTRPIVAPQPYQQVPMQPMPMRTGVNPSVGLDAVIEMEVSRRLNERINAAKSMNQQALAMMNHPSLNPMKFPILSQQQQPQYGQFYQNQQAQGLMAQFSRQGLNFKFDGSMPMPLTPAYGDSQPLNTMPKTNIQGNRAA